MDTNYLILIGAVIAVIAVVLLLRQFRTRALPGSIDQPEAIDAAPVEPMIAPVVVIAEAVGPPDTLTTIKGLGPRAAAQLNTLGITRFDQLAALSGSAIEAVDAQMGNFQGRITRDRWIEQAGHLAIGDTAGFEAKFGKLGG